MKNLLALTLTVLTLLFAHTTMACAQYKDSGSCAWKDSQCDFSNTPGRCGIGDNGYLYNDCINQYTYFRAFGNIGK